MFALANTGIVVGTDWIHSVTSTNTIGIIAGLIFGKPLGVTLLCVLAVAIGLCRLPPDLNWRHRIYDVNFHCQSRVCRTWGDNKRLKNGNSFRVTHSRNRRLSMA